MPFEPARLPNGDAPFSSSGVEGKEEHALSPPTPGSQPSTLNQAAWAPSSGFISTTNLAWTDVGSSAL